MSGYESYDYLQGDLGLPVVELAPEFGRVPPYDGGFAPEVVERAERLLVENITVSLHDHPGIAAASEALQEVYPDQEALLAVIAGTLPATALFEETLGVKTLFFSFATADENAHAPNEFLRIRRIDEGMRAWEALWTRLAAAR